MFRNIRLGNQKFKNIQKHKYNPQNTQKPKFKQIKKLCREASNEKKIRKQMVELKNSKNDIFKNFKN